MRTVWNEPRDLHLFYILIINRFGKHYEIQLRLWLMLGLGLKYTAGACGTTTSFILLDSIHNLEHVKEL